MKRIPKIEVNDRNRKQYQRLKRISETKENIINERRILEMKENTREKDYISDKRDKREFQRLKRMTEIKKFKRLKRILDIKEND